MTILNPISKKKLIDFSDIYQHSNNYLQEHPRFSIWFSPGLFGIYKKQICRKILDPLIPATELILIYGLQTKKKKIQKFKSYLKEKYGRHILNMAGKRWEYFIPLLYKLSILSTITEIRESILIQCLNKDIPWENIFKHCYGPIVLGNPSVCCGKTVLSYTKRKFNDCNVFFIVEKLNCGLEGITITCHKDMITNIFDIAARTCSLTAMLESDYELIEKAGESFVSE